MAGEGDREVFFFVGAKREGVLLQHHVDFKAVPFLLDADGFLKRGRVLHRAGDFNHGIVERVDIEFRLLVIAIDFDARCRWCLRSHREEATQQQRCEQ